MTGEPEPLGGSATQLAGGAKEIGFEQYVQAEETGWVLYLEGSTDLAILRAFAEKLNHPSREALERPFVHYVANWPAKAKAHFYGLREAKPDLLGLALYDRLDTLPADPNLSQEMWRRREIENYLCQTSTLLAWAEAQGARERGEFFAHVWRESMERAIAEIAAALAALGKPDPWSRDLEVGEEFLDPLFRKFYELVKLPNLMRMTDYHALAPFVEMSDLDPEVSHKLDAVSSVASRAQPHLGK